MMRRHRMARFLKMALMGVAALALFSFLVLQLWNWLMPPVFGWHRISFFQAVGLLVLSKLLFGGFRGGWGHRGRFPRGMRDRWEQMTPEEREKFRKGMKGCWMRPENKDSAGVGQRGTAPAVERQPVDS